MNAPRSRQRIAWVDLARGYGIILVFYGHIVEAFAHQGYLSAGTQSALIYSFHMPLFFVIAGYLGRMVTSAPGSFFKERFRSRVFPMLFFNLTAIPIHIAGDVLRHAVDPPRYVAQLGELVQGKAPFNLPTWFLVCLFSVETIYYISGAHRRSTRLLIGSALFSLTLGLAITANLDRVSDWMGIAPNFWYVHEALVAYAFYLFGVIARREGLLDGPVAVRKTGPLFVALVVALLYLYPLNRGPFRISNPVVTMIYSSHGNPLLFPVTALIGSLAVVMLARLTPALGSLQSLGRNSLIYFALNGFLMHFVNPRLAVLFRSFMPDSPVLNTAAYGVLTLISLLVCMPLVSPVSRTIAAASSPKYIFAWASFDHWRTKAP